MQKAGFLGGIADDASPLEERLTRLVQFVALNGGDIPVEGIPSSFLPVGYRFRCRFVRDLVLCVAVPEAEARDNPTGAAADSAQLWQLHLGARGGIVARRCGVVCTVNGALTAVTRVDDRRRAEAVLLEWAACPPTDEELGTVEPALH